MLYTYARDQNQNEVSYQWEQHLPGSYVVNEKPKQRGSSAILQLEVQVIVILGNVKQDLIFTR